MNATPTVAAKTSALDGPNNKIIDTAVAVIGGGAVGCAVLRELSLNGIPCVLLEKNKVCCCTPNVTTSLRDLQVTTIT